MPLHGSAATALLAALLLTCAPAAPRTGELMAPDPPDRGRYLALHVSLCVFCHSEIDWKAEGYPPRQDGVAAGRAPFSDATPGLSAPNLTPDPDTGLGRWTDEQIERAVRRGVGRDGRALHPAMPSASFRRMSDDDVAAITAYLRSLPPVTRAVPAPELSGTLPAAEPPAPVGGDLVAIALCATCHTPADDRGRPIPGMDFAGGVRLKGPWGDLHAPNITPDASGISEIGEKNFLHAMKTGELPGRTLHAIMPWGYYRRMTDDDLRAIYRAIMAAPPVRHLVDNRVAPTPCRKCGRPHGLGDRN